MGSSPRVNHGFAFNNANFSDRILHIEIMPVCHCERSRKRKREDLDDEHECSTVAEVKTLHISSLILAADSPFFYKLFENATGESHQRDVTLRINKSEEAALMGVLNFMYNNTLSVTTAPEVLGVLKLAAKYEIGSCMRYCSELLQTFPMSLESALFYIEQPSSNSTNKLVQPLIDAAKKFLVARHKMPMSLESALLYLELPSSSSANKVVQPLIDAAKELLVARYGDIMKCREEAKALPLCAIEVILSSDSLKVKSEDDLYDFLFEWLGANFPKPEERCAMLTKRMVRFIRFPYMGCLKLLEVLACPEFDSEEMLLVLRALFFKLAAGKQNFHDSGALDGDFTPRRYDTQPVKVVQFDQLSRPRCVVYFDLKKEDCADLFQKSRILGSEQFLLGGRPFWLLTQCLVDQQTMLDHFALFVVMKKESSETFTIDYECAVMTKPLEEFESLGNVDKCTPMDKMGIGMAGDFGIPWTEFMADDSKYFFNGILHLRVKIAINNSQP